MDYRFDISKKRQIAVANRNEYVQPSFHPDRRMAEHDLIYIIEGEWKIGQDGEPFHVRRGDVLILAAQHHHYGIEPCAAGTRTMFIHALCNPGDGDADCEGGLTLPCLIRTGESPVIRNLFEKVIYAQADGEGLTASSYFDVLLCELAQCVRQGRDGLAEKMRQMILSSGRILKNTELARAFNVSVKTAENAFKSAFGISIHRYVTEVKIGHVKFYLTSFPEMKLHEMAVNLGYYDEFHLGRQFKKEVGMTPGEYRRRYR